MFIEAVAITLNLLAAVGAVLGLFFLFVGAVGIYRLPDAYNRLHAASKSITLGIIGLLSAAVLHLAVPDADYSTAEALAAAAKAVLVIAFQFVAAPVGSHMLAKAGHVDHCALYPGTEDEFAQDKREDEDNAWQN